MGLFSRKPKLPDRTAALLVIHGFDVAMQKVRDLERLHRFEEAAGLFEPAIQATARVLRNEPDGFGVLLRALTEAEARGRADLVAEVADALQANPKAKTVEGAAAVATKQYAVASPNAATFYACQNCGALIWHVTVSCTDCGFIPDDQQQALKAAFLSTAYISPAGLVSLGERIRRGFDFDQLGRETAGRFAAVAADELAPAVASELLQIARNPARRNLAVISPTARCANCGSETKRHFWTARCEQCGSTRLSMPAAAEYKMLLRDALLWLQTVPFLPPDLGGLRAFLGLLVRLKEKATHEGRQATQEEGVALKRAMEGLGSLTDRRGRYTLTFGLHEVTGQPLVDDFDPTAGLDQVANAGPALFNRLVEFAYQGRALK
ncbi:MAG: hypothetical protein ACOY5V_18555 [Pseudomonadota bacterium]